VQSSLAPVQPVPLLHVFCRVHESPSEQSSPVVHCGLELQITWHVHSLDVQLAASVLSAWPPMIAL
jgi:hypothetical protein